MDSQRSNADKKIEKIESDNSKLLVQNRKTLKYESGKVNDFFENEQSDSRLDKSIELWEMAKDIMLPEELD